ncbi:MAG: methyltransferase domain-containing protein [Hyphomicrobium sp.]|uniref:class I SAM-dependent methyltransferase n=1 Tax=Hyphomicrobium sp. TaxID=82 RepID=UPI0039E532E2
MDIEAHRLNAAQLSGGISNSSIYAAALSAAKAQGGEIRNILDYGSGAGRFIPILASTFPRATIAGADIMERPDGLSAAANWIRGDLNYTLPAAANSFDLVFAVEVIEHLENPRQMLRDINRMLTPGGVAVLTTPNPGSLRSLLTFVARGHHANFDDSNYPAHITVMTAVDFKRAGNETGFEPPQFFYTNVGCVPKLLKLKWQDVPGVGGLFRGKFFSDNYGAVLRKPVIC